MQTTVTEHKDIKIVHLDGRLDVKLSREIEIDLESLLNAGVNRMVISLENLECLSSSGIRVFIAILRKLNENNGKMVFCQIPPQIRNIFKVVELEELFEIHDTMYEAFKAFET